MRITMIAFGSTGDVYPYLVLARELKKRNHDVAICAFPQFREKILAEGMRFFPVKGDLISFMGDVVSSSNGVTYIKNLIDNFKPRIMTMLDSIEEACDDAEALMGVYFGEVFKSMAEVRHIPYIQTQYAMLDPNPDMSPAILPQSSDPLWNQFTYKAGYSVISLVEMIYLSSWRKSRGMTPRKLTGKPIYEINGHPVPVMYLMSPNVVPPPASWGEHIRMTGFLLDEQQQDFTPSPELEAFLRKDPEHTVYIGFGSMVSENYEEGLKIVLDSVDRAGVKAVVSKGWGGVEIESRENIFVVDFIPHTWLFQHVSAVAHHCGAGTTAAGIFAGKPAIAVPFGSDQPFWADRIFRLGLGPRPIPYKKLSVELFSEALRDVTTNKRYHTAAAELGKQLHKERSDVAAADFVEEQIEKWLQTDKDIQRNIKPV